MAFAKMNNNIKTNSLVSKFVSVKYKTIKVIWGRDGGLGLLFFVLYMNLEHGQPSRYEA